MNKRTISLVIATVVLFSVVSLGIQLAPVTATNVQANPATPIAPAPQAIAKYIVPKTTLEKLLTASKAPDIMLMPYQTGLRWVPLEKYEKVTGIKFPVFSPEAFKKALESAPVYPGRPSLKVTAVSLLNTSLPSQVTNTLYLPPIGNQGAVGSCNAWSSTYYVWTYMINWWRNNPFPKGNAIMNPTFTYNLINGGGDYGSMPWDAMNLLATIGAVGLYQFPLYNASRASLLPPDYAYVWPNLTQWMIAPHNRGVYAMYFWQLRDPYNPYKLPGQWYILYLNNKTQWEYLKGLLAKGYVMQTAIMVLPSFSFLDHPEQFVGLLQFYGQYATQYAEEYWANQSYANGTYTNWTVGQMIEYAHQLYNLWAQYTVNQSFNGNKTILYYLELQGNYSLLMMEKTLAKYNISLSDKVYNATQKIGAGIATHFINNQTWWNEADFYLSAYSFKGEEWFVNHGFVDLYTLANFEWMIHYIPIDEYLGRAPFLNFYNYYYAWTGGHAVTIVGYDDNVQTPDGQGALVMVNSWGTDWGNNGYWLYSYQAATSTNSQFFYVDGMLPLSIFISWGEAWVYVPKAANYQPKMMAIVNIKHPVRGEVIDGVYNTTNYKLIEPAGIPIGTYVYNGSSFNEVWNHTFLDFWMDYIGVNSTSQLVNTSLSGIPQAHPFPNSSMAFDITNALTSIEQYVNETGKVPEYVALTLLLSDKVIDNYTGTLREFSVEFNTPSGMEFTLFNLTPNAPIPQGNWGFWYSIVPTYRYVTAPTSAVNRSDFKVGVLTIIPAKSARLIVIDAKTNETVENVTMATEDGYYFELEGLNVPQGLYKYYVELIYNKATVDLPVMYVKVVGPAIIPLRPGVGEIVTGSALNVTSAIFDTVNVTNATAVLDGKALAMKLVYGNATNGVYETSGVNLTAGYHTVTIKAYDVNGNYGEFTYGFTVVPGANVVSFGSEAKMWVARGPATILRLGLVGNMSNITTGKPVVNMSINVGGTLYNLTLPNISTVEWTTIEALIVNGSAIEKVSKNETPGALAAWWNASLSGIATESQIVTENGKRLKVIKIQAKVNMGPWGLAVLAIPKNEMNISRITVTREDGTVVDLTTNTSSEIGYYFVEGNVIFIVLKEDPIVTITGVETLPTPTGITPQLLMTLTYFYYRNYELLLPVYHELYANASAMGVSNETLALAEALYQNATMYFQKAEQASFGGNILTSLGNIRVFTLTRLAYFNLKKAVEVLERAVEMQNS